MTGPCTEECQLAKDAEAIKVSLSKIESSVERLDHGLNGVNGSIGLVRRVEGIEGVIRQNRVLWTRLRGINSNAAIIFRTVMIAGLIALGGYIWGSYLANAQGVTKQPSTQSYNSSSKTP